MLRKLVLALALVFSLANVAGATPLDSGSWTQVGYMAPDDFMFDGNCNLISSSCTYGPDASGDFWVPFPETYPNQEILFITGNQQYWASGSYEAVAAIVSAAAGVFSPNMNWSDAGIAGVSVGPATGNILMRAEIEDPWVTLRGSHCAHLTTDAFPIANDCNLVLWGEKHFSPAGPVHKSLKNSSGGVEVYISSAVPEPTTGLLLGLGLLGVAARRRHIG